MEKPEISYKSPKEVRAEGNPLPEHHFELKINNEVVGGAEMAYYSKPLPYYSLSHMWVKPEHQGNHYGSQLMDQVEAFLIARKKPGMLSDAIEEDSPAHGMYERRGWQKIPDAEDEFVFNWPKGVSLDILKGELYRYTDMSTRRERRGEGPGNED